MTENPSQKSVNDDVTAKDSSFSGGRDALDLLRAGAKIDLESPQDERNQDGDDDSISVCTTHNEPKDHNPNNFHQSTKRAAADKERATLAKNETKAVGLLRLILIAVMVLTTVIVSIAVYRYTHNDQIQDYESDFEALAIRVIQSFHNAVERKLGAIDSLSASITSYALATNATFPNVTVPNFDVRGANTRILSDGLLMYYAPLVTDETRPGWEEYSRQHYQHLMKDFLAETDWKARQDEFFGLLPNEQKEQDQTNDSARRTLHFTGAEPHFNEVIWEAGAVDDTPSPQLGRYLPMWHMSPVLPLMSLLNVNLLEFPDAKQAYEKVFETNQAVMDLAANYNTEENDGVADVFSINLAAGQYRHDVESYLGDPASVMAYPVFDNFTRNRTVAGMLITNLYWRLYFNALLPDNVRGMICVLENDGGQVFSYRIDGSVATYLGVGDYHDSKYNDMEETADLIEYVQKRTGPETRSFTTVELNDNFYRYTLRVYPSDEFRDLYVDESPIVYTVIVAMVFLFSGCIFAIYDCLVERRQTVVMDKAVRSTAVVSSLFPENVRDRLLNDDDDDNDNYDNNNNNRKNNNNIEGENKKREYGNNKWKRTSETLSTTLSASNDSSGNDPALLLDMVNNSTSTNDKDSTTKSLSTMSSNTTKPIKGKPIADLFPAATVLFADLVGFTKWSAGRKPEEVFTLLETLYHGFDIIALHRKVFKVETIGDCYMAVTGVPTPQSDHVVIMAKFARDCMIKMKQVTKELASALGSDTRDLSCRIGIHSGEVTAGVLRGEKSRFQLFGDTVNTAARMESTGEAGRIQCSESSADGLIAAGKGHWINPRDDMVTPKGKQPMKTFWINFTSSPSQHHGEGTVLSVPIDTDDDKTDKDVSVNGSSTVGDDIVV